MLELADFYQDDLTQRISSLRGHAPVWDGSDVLANTTFPSAAAGRIVDPPLQVTIVRSRQMPPEAIQEAIRQTSALVQLPRGWNSYNAKSISNDAIFGAIAFLLEEASAVPNIAAPSVVPTVRGGLQLEWHRRGVDIEIEFSPNNAASWCAEDRTSGEVIEKPLVGHAALIQEWLERASD